MKPVIGRCIPVLTMFFLAFTAISVHAGEFDPGRAGFSISVGKLQIPYRVFAVFVKSSEEINITSATDFALISDTVDSHLIDNGRAFIAPAEAGWYPLVIQAENDRIELNVFVTRPATDMQNGNMGTYRIGRYARKPFRNLPVYKAPEGFVEAHKDYSDIRLSPHFTLGQFYSKQSSGWPKYLILRPQLLIKLENILEKLNSEGIRTERLEIMSGYRTPWYNHSIGNRTTSSRHLYGGAADIFIDVNPRDGKMDDLNGDGKITKADAVYLYDLLEKWSNDSWWNKLTGGLAAYGSTAAHGPFVHIDTRGYKARWGH